MRSERRPLTALVWAVISLAHASASAQPNLSPYQHPGYSNNIIVSTMTGTAVDAALILPTDALYLDFAWANIGNTSTAAGFDTDLYVDGLRAARWTTEPPLEPGGARFVVDIALGNLPAGLHTLTIRVDPANAVAESNEADNEYTRQVTVTNPYQSGSWVLPSSAFRMGANGAEFHSDVRILNLSPSPVPVNVAATFYDQASGTTFLAPAFPIAGASQASFDNILQSLFRRTLANGSFGPIRFEATGPIIVSSSTNNVNACGTGAMSGQWLPGIDTKDAMLAGVIPHLAVSANPQAGYRTNLVITNPGTANATATVNVRSGSGTLLSSGTIGPLAPHGFSQVSLDNSATFPGLAGMSDENLWVEFASDQPVLAFASVINNQSGDPFAVVATPDAGGGPGGSWILPSSAFRTGLNDAEFRTDVRILNTGAAPVTVAATLYDQASATTIRAPEVRLEGRSQTAFDNVLQTLFKSTLEKGSYGPIRFDATGAIFVSATVNNVNACGTGARAGQWLQGIAVTKAVKDGVIPQLAVSADASSGYRTNLVVMNPGGAAATTAVKVKAGGGVLISTGTLGPLGPNGFSQVPLDSPAEFPGVRGRTDSNLWIGFTSDQPVIAFASVINNASGDPFAVVAIPDALSSHPGPSLFSQQGPKLVGTGAVGAGEQGWSVSLSGDGGTAIVGGYGDDKGVGAAWIWRRSGGVWAQEGPKLIGPSSPYPSFPRQGGAVCLSGDGETAIVGGFQDIGPLPNEPKPSHGAVWVWQRSGSTWIGQPNEQGSLKLNAMDATGMAFEGYSVSLSADGNTAVVGGPIDNAQTGAAWVWTRSAGVWKQQGPKLIGSGAVGSAGQGSAVSVSADGNTAIVGGPSDNGGAGAAWVWTRSGGVWSQEGPKLVGSGGGPSAQQGWSVALSGDGNTAIVGGPFDPLSPADYGAVWIWTRSGGVWRQQGPKLVGSGAGPNALQGMSVSLSGDGNTAVVGGPGDGAAWVWTRRGGTWTQQGPKLAGSGAVGNAQLGHSVSVSADGSTAIAGGPSDNSEAGAAWVFTAPPR